MALAPDAARTILWSVAGVMIAWTVTCRIFYRRLGQNYTTSVQLRLLFSGDPILGHLLQVFAFMLFVCILPEFGIGDLFLAWVVWVGLGHIVWGFKDE